MVKKGPTAPKSSREKLRAQALLLAELLAQTPEYVQYTAAKMRLQENTEHSYLLSELRQQQWSLRLAAMLGEDIEAEASDFELVYDSFCREPVVSDFLYAEGRFTRLVADLQEIFGDRLDLWSDIAPMDRGDMMLN